MGILVFLWFIVSGLLKSNEAKRKHAGRQGDKPRTKTTPRPNVFEQPRTEPKKASHPPKTEPLPMPEWFPFPLELPKVELPKGETAKNVKDVKKVAAKDETSKSDKREKPQVLNMPKVKEKVAPTFIEIQEEEWQTFDYGLNDIDKKAVVNGIVWAEVLGPPRAKKKFTRG
ncbi:MAG: hypothetical protein ACOYJ1_00120 [Peptococcales bacterium]